MADAGLSFKDLTVVSSNPHKVILNKVSGYVQKGGITAVMGPSASGKSVLLQTLSGRIQDLVISGDVFINGRKVNPKSTHNPIAYVPQDDSLIGELTAREVTTITAVLKRNEPLNVLTIEVNDLLTKLGLSHVADGIIGTLIFRGLSGGQKKRVEISSELIASPSILLMDEPTSGLDSSVAFEVLNAVKTIVKSSQGKLSVIISIHQPNSRILELFDNLLLLDNGAAVFQGSLPEAMQYFEKIGFPCPPNITPTDYFLQISDSNFKYTKNFDFEETYYASGEYVALMSYLDGADSADMVIKSYPTKHVSAFQQFYTLVYREYSLAYRDPTLYYFQLVLMLQFGFLTGAVFFQMPQGIDPDFNIFSGAILWLVLMNGWVHIFKVYHISKTDKRTIHELSNNKYNVLVWCAADLFTSASISCIFMPVAAIAYSMMGLPQVAFPFLLLNFWMTSLASEAMLSFLTKFSTNPTSSMIVCQIALVNLQVFGGGLFIPWKDCPRWWVWLQEIAVFTQSSRAAIMEVYDHMQFICALNGGTVCINSGSGDKFPCSTPIIDDKCYVDGRTILEVTQGIGKADSFWNYFGALCAIFVFFKAGVILLTVYPWERVVFKVGSILYPSKVDLRELQKVRNEQKLESLLTSDLSSEVMSLSPGASLTWTGLSVILPNSNKILIDNVSGSVSNGKVLALMGPSGAGKTTLLNALAKRASYARVEGQILYGGRAMTATDLTYVPQFDEVNRILTVLEVMTLVGKLTCVDETEMNQRLEIVISVLGLQSKRNAQIKNLSGGEVKRVSVGIGLISKPHVLFLDEPTTGLDSTASYSIVKYLVQIAKTTNVAVIMTIHQPSALMFDMLDDLLLLETGRIAYGGSVKAAALYFSNVGFANPHMINPADYYLELVQKNPSEDGRTWRDLLEGSIQGSDYVEQIDAILAAKVEIAPTIQPSAFSRYVTLFNYFMVYFFREPGFYRSRTIALSIIAIYAGTIFLQLTPTTHNISNYVGAMFFSVIAMMLTAVSSTALFAKDRYEAVDRVKNGIYTPAVFVLAQFSAAAIYNLIAAFIFASIFHWLVNINPNGESFIFDIFIGWGHMMLMEAVLLTVIEALKNDFLSTTSGMVFLGSCMAFSGFFRAVDQMPPWISWMSYILPLKYTFDGFVWQIFHTQSFAITGSNPTTYISGDDVLSTVFNLSNINSWGMFGVCLAYVALFRLNQYTLFAWQMDMLFTKTEKTITTVKKATLAARGTNDSFKVSSNSLAAKNDMNV